MEQPIKKPGSQSELASKELLEALEESKDIKRLGDHRDDFLADIGAVADSNTKTKAVYIYWAYLKFCYKNSVKPIYRKRFFRGFKELYKQKVNNRNFYFVKSPAFIISKEEKKLMLRHLKEELEYYKWLKEEKEKFRQKEREKHQRKKQKELNEALIQDLKKLNSQE